MKFGLRRGVAMLMASTMLVGPYAQATAHAAPTNVTGVSFSADAKTLAVRLLTDGRPMTDNVRAFAQDASGSKWTVVVDFSPAIWNDGTKVQRYTDSSIHAVRVGQLVPNVVRIAIDVVGKPTWAAGAVDGGYALTVNADGVAVLAPTGKAAFSARPAAAAVAQRPIAPSPTLPCPIGWKFCPRNNQPATQPSIATSIPAVKAPVIAAPTVAKATSPRVLAVVSVVAKVAPRRVAPSLPNNAIVSGSTGQTVSLDVKDADLVDVLRLLAKESGKSIVTAGDIKGTVTLGINRIPLQAAIDIIVRANNLDYRVIDGVYVVGDPIYIAKAFGPGAGASGMETVGIRIRYADPVVLAKNLATVIPPTDFTVDPASETIVVYGAPEVVKQAQDYLAVADVAPPQVMYEVQVLDITKNNDNSSQGFNWGGSSVLDVFENSVASAGASQSAPPPVASGNSFSPTQFTRNALFIAGQVNLLLQHNDAKLLADPKLAVINNQDAKMLVGETYPIVYYSPQAGNFQVQYIDVGVKLDITPTINPDGYVTTKIHAERSSISGVVQNFPILATRSADSVLRAKDGETIVMGGMIDDEYTESLSKIPGLSSLPIFGFLFRNTNTTKVHNDVVFLITPHIVTDKDTLTPAQAAAAANH